MGRLQQFRDEEYHIHLRILKFLNMSNTFKSIVSLKKKTQKKQNDAMRPSQTDLKHINETSVSDQVFVPINLEK